ncbi:Ctr copper transporter [Thozetella sp. PMI_491]|nr:Ctr copper transporter [Thozetella sp. PMI_491]
MLWNWNTIDACFLSPSWRITSNAMFAGSCLGVVVLVILLEALRRGGKEYDCYLVRMHLDNPAPPIGRRMGSLLRAAGNKTSVSTQGGEVAPPLPPCAVVPFRPSFAQQAVRALLHMLQFALAYILMLLAMYYNGYFIICIFLGAYIGAFLFQWETLADGRPATSAVQDATVCCG